MLRKSVGFIFILFLLNKNEKSIFFSARLDVHHQIRFELKKKNLITEGPNKLHCGGKKGQGHCWVGLGMQFSYINQFTRKFHLPSFSCLWKFWCKYLKLHNIQLHIPAQRR